MIELPNWAWYALAAIGSVFVLGYLRALAAVAEDSLGVHKLRHEAAELQILQIKQLRAIQLGLHPGDIFVRPQKLDEMIAKAEARLDPEPEDAHKSTADEFPDVEIIEDVPADTGEQQAAEPATAARPAPARRAA